MAITNVEMAHLRWKGVSKEQRSELMRNAANKRWAKKRSKNGVKLRIGKWLDKKR